MNPRKVILRRRRALGKTLRARREELGWTQSDLAEAADIRQNEVSQIETGAVNYGVDKLLAVQSALDRE